MDFYENYKKRREELKEKSINISLEEGKKCWEKHHSKRKADYNECSKNSVFLYHVFSDGKRRLNAKKRENKQKCEELANPAQLKICKLKVYEDLCKDLESLNRKLDREYLSYKASL
ncbi:unnamed protein product [Blepharisma stoltei]|uniref:Uncharacterized protein n=1 Tax=Blepharisma stoltei TaxID=1481888 RepID=A0AAU9JJE7_9CILI|nr:unnamed protein product [Blepharisma stoltei]